MSSPPFTVKAVFEYASEHEDDLTFPIAQVLTVTAVEDDDWYYGEYTDDSGSKQEGIFPKNFVERYEPPAPPRPSRPAARPKRDSTPVESPVDTTTSPVESTSYQPPPQQQPEPESVVTPAAVQPPSPPPQLQREEQEEEEQEPQQQPALNSPQSPVASAAPVAAAAAAAAPPAPAPVAEPPPTTAAAEPAPKPAAKPPPPAAAPKPSSSSFRDRIAAFNKPTEAPIAPIKPGGLSSGSPSSFVKKPFVAAPPSRNAYVPPPPPREPVQKIYRREEDPEFQQSSSASPAAPVPEPSASESRPPPVVSTESTEEDAEDQPKPTSLKDRIALLQKRQAEQAARHADAAQKKEKPPAPKKAPKKPDVPEGGGIAAPPMGSEPAESDDRDHSAETLKAATAGSPTVAHEPPSDANDADYSAAADTEDTEDTLTSREDLDSSAQPRASADGREATAAGATGAAATHHDDHQHEGDGQQGDREEAGAEEEEEEEEEEIDPEVKRKMELRERMAKMSGGMGMMNLFGAPAMPVPGAGSRKPKASTDSERKPEPEATSPVAAPPVPVMALPGMKPPTAAAPVQKEEEPAAPQVSESHDAEELPDAEDATQEEPRSPAQERAVPPPPPLQTRPVPPPVPQDSLGSPPQVPGARPIPPPPPRSPPTSADPGNESDDELSTHARNMSLNAIADDKAVPTPLATGVAAGAPPPPPPEHGEPRRSSTYDSSSSPRSPTGGERRISRAAPPPPPVPTSPPASPPRNRAPPPPPPGSLPRRSTADSRTSTTTSSHVRQAGDVEGEEVTEYDGDYDTDIASGDKFKDSLKAPGTDSSVDETATTDDFQSPPPSRQAPPPLPTAPRGVPPPPPSHPKGRTSVDVPRGPPPPPPMAPPAQPDDDEYDPFRYTNPQHGIASAGPSGPPPSAPPAAPPVAPPSIPMARPPQPQPDGQDDDDLDREHEELYDASPVAPEPQSPSHDKRMSGAVPLVGAAPVAGAGAGAAAAAAASAAPSSGARSNRASLDVPRGQAGVRRSVDVPRPSVDHGYIATDIDMAEQTQWWTQPNTPPPVIQNRRDVRYEIEESTSTKRGGKSNVTKDIYVLFMDYSQTVISVSYDPRNPTELTSAEQRQEPPPHQPRQDQLEEAHSQIGTRINTAVNAIQNSTVGDGTPFGLIQHLLDPLPNVLLPVGTRAFGALVYTNLANATVQQYDEIRAGDLVSFRNARFQGHRGTMHQKYSAEVGKPDHVGVVVDWDGTKKKIRAWEQGRESRKVKMESFRLGDLRSGECKVWRVMSRSFVGWEN